MLNFLRRHSALWIALGVWVAVIAVVIVAAISQTGGMLVYGLDDAYIHLSMAKHFLAAGVWGVTPYEFSSSSSSPIWPLVLALGAKVFGALGLLPLLLNVAASIFLITKSYAIARRYYGNGWQTAAFPLGMALLLPAAPLVMIGMESLWFAAIALAFADSAVEFLVAPTAACGWKLMFWSLALTSLRYEGLFLVAAACLLFLARRRWRIALGVGAVALIPAVAYGSVSLSLGWYALPNSLMIKHSPLDWTDPVSFWNMAARIFLPIADTLTISIPRWNSFLYAAGALWAIRVANGERWEFWTRPVLATSLFTGTALLHGMLVAVEWQFRYEAYLIALGLWAIGSLLAGSRRTIQPKWGVAAAWGLCLLLAYAPVKGAIEGTLGAPTASRNIYEQQVQMGRFLNRYYNGQAVVANDIGAVDFFADIHLVDAYGLASLPVAQTKQAGAWESRRSGILRTQALSAGADVAVLYDTWFANGADIPSEWVRVERWTIRDNIVCGSDTVSWYATGAAAVLRLREQLRAFRLELPGNVLVSEEAAS
jgi:hypothetical protein